MESDLQNLLTLKDSILEEIEALKISQATIMDQFTGIKTQIDAKQTGERRRGGNHRSRRGAGRHRPRALH